MDAKGKLREWGHGLWRDKGMCLSAFYLFLPIALFFLGWLHLILALPLCLLLCWLFLRMGRSLCAEGCSVGFRDKPEYWLALCVVVFFWVSFSGIGGFSYQNGDFFVRNPIYRDLVNQPWPVYFDLSSQKEAVRAVVGDSTVAFVYYFCFWLPPALLSKLFAGSELLSNFFLLGWAYLGVMLVLYQIHRYLKKVSWVIPAVFILFGGLDAIGYWLLKGSLPFGEHLEWWCTYFQYSSNSTVLYWVFNQGIPVWLAVVLLMNMRGNTSTVSLCALVFAYSPFATFGMVPLAVYSVFRRGQKWRKAVTWENVLMPLLLLLVFGSFYLSNPGSVSVKGWIFQFYPLKDLLWHYLLFLLLEVGVYALPLRKCLKKYEYLWMALAELALIPFYRMTPANDFAMRASLPCLMVLSVCLMRYLLEECLLRWKKRVVILVLALGSITPLSELYRSAYNTARDGAVPVDWVYSFQEFATEDVNTLETCKRQFFTYDPEEQFFFRYLGKKKEIGKIQ